MTKTINLLLASLFFTAAVHAQAYDIYASGNIGMAMLHAETTFDDESGISVDYDFDNGLVYAAAIGLINGQYRSEVEYLHQSSDLDDPADFGIESARISANAGLVNAYYDIPMGGIFSPYVSAGLGYGSFKSRFVYEDPDLSGTNKDSTMLYHIGTGGGFTLSENIVLEIRYRYLTGQKLKYEDSQTSFKTHNFSAGMRVTF